jgi:gamma-glutamyl-gamma-aminobutyrate hydrolase PuuD
MFLRYMLLKKMMSDLAAANNNNADNKPTDYQYALNTDEKNQLKSLRTEDTKPKVVALYDKAGGTTHADLTIDFLEKKGFEVIKVTPQEGIQHPVLSNFPISGSGVDGIYLPGGPDIDSPFYVERRKFESELLDGAHSNDIPVLGICRGNQVIGEHYVLLVRNASRYHANEKVIVTKDSQLYQAVHHKFKKNGIQHGASIEYHVKCAHWQLIIENEKNKTVEVSARTVSDNKIESIQVKTGKYYTIGSQHHPEKVITECEEDRRSKLDELSRRQIFLQNFYPELIAYNELKIREANKKSVDELAARAEIGLFANQVKKKFLNAHSYKQPSSNIEKNRNPL